jgi:hypothetical protein
MLTPDNFPESPKASDVSPMMSTTIQPQSSKENVRDPVTSIRIQVQLPTVDDSAPGPSATRTSEQDLDEDRATVDNTMPLLPSKRKCPKSLNTEASPIIPSTSCNLEGLQKDQAKSQAPPTLPKPQRKVFLRKSPSDHLPARVSGAMKFNVARSVSERARNPQGTQNLENE